MANVGGLKKVAEILRKKAEKAKKEHEAVVAVGFTAAYALFVHENLEMVLAGKPRASGVGVYWGPAGQAKFLEGPAREMAAELGQIVAKAMQSKRTLAESLLLAGLRLQRESQTRVPVEYGNLRASAFTRQEK